MSTRSDESSVVYPEVFTLHWEGPPQVAFPPEPVLPGSPEKEEWTDAEAREREERRRERGRALWHQIEREAGQRGDGKLWRRKLDAYRWVKLEACGSAADYAARQGINHATVRSWIADVAKLAYRVGYRLHEDRLLLVGAAPPELRRLRELVNADPGSRGAWRELRAVESRFRGEDAYFHLNEGHVLRAHGRLPESDDTLREGLALAEAPRLRSLLWNARGQTYWDWGADSTRPLPDHRERAEKAFRRAAVLDPSLYFPFVNLIHLAVDAGDLRRAEYWLGELGAARKGMEESMKDDLARYLREAEWTGMVEGRRCWKQGPLRWLHEAARNGLLALAAALTLLAASPPPSPPPLDSHVETVAHGPVVKRGGAGGN